MDYCVFTEDEQVVATGWSDCATVDFSLNPPKPTATPLEIVEAVETIEQRSVPDV